MSARIPDAWSTGRRTQPPLPKIRGVGIAPRGRHAADDLRITERKASLAAKRRRKPKLPQTTLMGVEAFVHVFRKEGREISAEAIAALAPYPVEIVAAAPDELRANGLD